MSNIYYDTVVEIRNKDVSQGRSIEYVEVSVSVSTSNKTLHDEIVHLIESYDASRPGQGVTE